MLQRLRKGHNWACACKLVTSLEDIYQTQREKAPEQTLSTHLTYRRDEYLFVYFYFRETHLSLFIGTEADGQTERGTHLSVSGTRTRRGSRSRDRSPVVSSDWLSHHCRATKRRLTNIKGLMIR